MLSYTVNDQKFSSGMPLGNHLVGFGAFQLIPPRIGHCQQILRPDAGQAPRYRGRDAGDAVEEMVRASKVR